MLFSRLFCVKSVILAVCLPLCGCGEIVYDASESADNNGEKPVAAVVADKGSGVASVYSADPETGAVELSDGAKTALSAAQNAANASGNMALIALVSALSSLGVAGASIVAANRKKKQTGADKAGESAEKSATSE